MKFDWIDFGLSRKDSNEAVPAIDKLYHTSTACLLASLLRRRNAPFSKAFCWLRRDEGILDVSGTDRVRHIDVSFPYAAYEKSYPNRLAVFADWLVRAIAAGAPELGIDSDEIERLTDRLSADAFTYVRTDKLKRAAGEPQCEVIYRHSPTNLTVDVNCKLPDGRNLSRSIDEHPFIRDELVYGRAITGCTLGESDELIVETCEGPL